MAMHICKNCGSSSPQEAARCVCCRIQNAWKTPADVKPIAEKSEKIQCLNCGTHFQSLYEKCPECRFPKSALSFQPPATDQQVIPFGKRMTG